MGFWKTLFQVCSGTDVFLRLTECRFGKALFHLIVLMVLLSLMLAWGHSCIAGPRIRSVCHTLFAEIGSLRFTPEGIRTAGNPGVKQSYLLDDRFRFDYYPGDSLSEKDVRNWTTTPSGVIVMDNGLVLWLENSAGSGEGKYMIAPLMLDANPMKTETVRSGLTGGELYRYLKNSLVRRSGQTLHFILPEADEKLVAEYLMTCFALMVFLGSLASMFLLMFLTVLFFSFLQYVWNFSQERRLAFRQILVVLIYAAFPALTAAALYSFFMIPLILPQTVFFVIYLIYYMVVFRKIRLMLNPPDAVPPEDDF